MRAKPSNCSNLQNLDSTANLPAGGARLAGRATFVRAISIGPWRHVLHYCLWHSHAIARATVFKQTLNIHHKREFIRAAQANPRHWVRLRNLAILERC
eukprot:639950-Amphidinium_carterae.1